MSGFKDLFLKNFLVVSTLQKNALIFDNDGGSLEEHFK